MTGAPKMTDAELICYLEAEAEDAAERGRPVAAQKFRTAAERIEEQAAALKLWNCPRCHGTGTYEGRCPDPQCGDSTWDHMCGGPTLQCTVPACVATRLIISNQ